MLPYSHEDLETIFRVLDSDSKGYFTSQDLQSASAAMPETESVLRALRVEDHHKEFKDRVEAVFRSEKENYVSTPLTASENVKKKLLYEDEDATECDYGYSSMCSASERSISALNGFDMSCSTGANFGTVDSMYQVLNRIQTEVADLKVMQVDVRTDMYTILDDFMESLVKDKMKSLIQNAVMSATQEQENSKMTAMDEFLQREWARKEKLLSNLLKQKTKEVEELKDMNQKLTQSLNDVVDETDQLRERLRNVETALVTQGVLIETSHDENGQLKDRNRCLEARIEYLEDKLIQERENCFRMRTEFGREKAQMQAELDNMILQQSPAKIDHESAQSGSMLCRDLLAILAEGEPEDDDLHLLNERSDITPYDTVEVALEAFEDDIECREQLQREKQLMERRANKAYQALTMLSRRLKSNYILQI